MATEWNLNAENDLNAYHNVSMLNAVLILIAFS